jgi:signal transduction histidine kinase
MPWADVAEQLVHELRESLTTILLWEQILRTSDDAAIRARAIDAIRESAHAQARLLERMVVLGRS